MNLEGKNSKWKTQVLALIGFFTVIIVSASLTATGQTKITSEGIDTAKINSGSSKLNITSDISLNSNSISDIALITTTKIAASTLKASSASIDVKGDLNLQNNSITNISTPQSPESVATKSYIDSKMSENSGNKTIWVDDTDRDGYIENHSQDFIVSAEKPAKGWVKVRWKDTSKYFGSSTQYDCYDKNSSAYPGQTNYFKTDRGDGSFDYDCDGSEGKKWTAYSTACDSAAQQDLKWYDHVPACGVEQDLTDEWETCDDGTRIQRCR